MERRRRLIGREKGKADREKDREKEKKKQRERRRERGRPPCSCAGAHCYTCHSIPISTSGP